MKYPQNISKILMVLGISIFYGMQNISHAATSPTVKSTPGCVMVFDAKMWWKLTTTSSSWNIRNAQKTENPIWPYLSGNTQSWYGIQHLHISTSSCTTSQKKSPSALLQTRQWLTSIQYWKKELSTRKDRGMCTSDCSILLESLYTTRLQTSSPDTRWSQKEIDRAAFLYLRDIFLGSAPQPVNTAHDIVFPNSSHIFFSDIGAIQATCILWAKPGEALVSRDVQQETITCSYDTLSSMTWVVPERPAHHGISHYAVTYWYDAHQKTTIYIRAASRKNTTITLSDLIASKKLSYTVLIKPIGLYTYKTY